MSIWTPGNRSSSSWEEEECETELRMCVTERGVCVCLSVCVCVCVSGIWRDRGPIHVPIPQAEGPAVRLLLNVLYYLLMKHRGNER